MKNYSKIGAASLSSYRKNIALYNSHTKEVHPNKFKKYLEILMLLDVS
jgi:hypothetical protein